MTDLDMELWGERAARRYDETAAFMYEPGVLDPAVAFLAQRAGDGPVLELAIGTGRVALPLAARGLTVRGIELSAPMAAELTAKPGGDAIAVTIGDMATATAPDPAPGSYGLVLVVWNSISNILSQDRQVACFANAARHLRPGGRFVVELAVPDLRRLPPGDHANVFHAGDTHVGIDVFDVVRQRLTSRHFWVGAGTAHVAESHHRYIWPSELDLMARLAGLELVERWADWEEAPFTADSESHISVWEKPGG